MAKGYALLSLEVVRGHPEVIEDIRSSSTQRVYVVWFGRRPSEGPLIGIGRAVPWKNFPGRVKGDKGASFLNFIRGAHGNLAGGFSKMRAIADKHAHVRGPMTLYNGKYYNAKHVAMMKEAGR